MPLCVHNPFSTCAIFITDYVYVCGVSCSDLYIYIYTYVKSEPRKRKGCPSKTQQSCGGDHPQHCSWPWFFQEPKDSTCTLCSPVCWLI